MDPGSNKGHYPLLIPVRGLFVIGGCNPLGTQSPFAPSRGYVLNTIIRVLIHTVMTEYVCFSICAN